MEPTIHQLTEHATVFLITYPGAVASHLSLQPPLFWCLKCFTPATIQFAIPKINMLCNLCCLKTRLRLLCNKSSTAQQPEPRFNFEKFELTLSSYCLVAFNLRQYGNSKLVKNCQPSSKCARCPARCSNDQKEKLSLSISSELVSNFFHERKSALRLQLGLTAVGIQI